MQLQCVTMWIGESLGSVERACLRSVLRQGHRMALYCYREPAGVPDGVEVRNAADILPEHKVFRHRSGSVGPFSDWFRYELQRRAAGTWLDTDVYLIAPLDKSRPYLFGEQQPGVLNNAVLRLPPDSLMLPELLRPFSGKTPPWLVPRAAYLRSRAREVITGRASVAQMPWGTTGPQALTAVARSLGLAMEALPSPVLYPVPWQRAQWILDPQLALEGLVCETTVAVHLWNECIRDFKDRPAPEGSFLDRLHEEGR